MLKLSVGKWNWLDDLPAEVTATLAGCAREQRLARGENLYRQGDPADALYQVLEGRILMRTYSSEGRELLYTHMQPGDCFGELGLIDDKPCHHDADAGVDTLLARIDRQAFANARIQYPEIDQALLRFLARRTRSIYATIEGAFLLDLPHRLARRIYDLYLQHSRAGQSDFACSHEDLAKMTGGSRQRVSATLKRWEREGWLQLAYGRITVLDAEHLTALAET